MSIMRIGLNGQRILRENPAGAEKYTYNLFHAMAKIDKNNTYVVYFENEPQLTFWQELSLNNPNWTYKVISKNISWTQFGLALELILHKVDVFFTSVHTLPILRNPLTRHIGMIHGLEYKFTGKKTHWFRKLFLGVTEWYVCQKSHRVIVPTQSVKQEIHKRGWAPENKVFVVNEGVLDVYHKRSANEVEEARRKFNLGTNPFLLYVSTIQPRKNLPRLFEAFSEVVKENDWAKNFKLLVVGKKGWDYEETFDAPKKLGIEENIIFLGRLPDEDIPALMSGAKCFAIVSLEEGFGLPVLEAMACETPLLISKIKPYTEVAGEHAAYVDPLSVNSIKDGLVKILTSPVDLDRISKAKEASRSFTWERTAERTLNIFFKDF